MLRIIKKCLFFPVANYFAFFARIRLSYWNPIVIVVTGSNGKTTLLNLIEAQLGKRARYSHHANSAIGIPFNILGLERKTLQFYEWPVLLFSAPFKIFAPSYKERLYVVEADCDRPGEGKFLANLLNPQVSIWVSVGRTHSMNFDKLVESKKFKTVEGAIAYEFGYFIKNSKELSIVNGDSGLIQEQLKRTKSKVVKISKKILDAYKVYKDRTEFTIKKRKYIFSCLLPWETFYPITMTLELMDYLRTKPDLTFSNFHLPAGRSSVFSGIRNTTLIDSSYNANLSSMTAALSMFDLIPASKKWAVLGDMLEQGKEEKEEHERLAELIKRIKLERIILMGPRISKYTYPKLKELLDDKLVIEQFINPNEVLEYLKKNIGGGELVLFKGARFLEGVIEHLLADKNDVKNLARREKIWEVRRKKWGL